MSSGPTQPVLTGSQQPVSGQDEHGRQSRWSSTRQGRGDRRFFWTYLVRELHRRKRQALLIAMGLGVGVGLVVIVTAASAGVRSAQAAVLHSLYGVGTDVTVTKAPLPLNPRSLAKTGPSSSRLESSPAKAGANSSRFEFSPGNAPQHIDIVAELDGLGALPTSSVASIARLSGVKAVAGGLSLLDTKLTIPSLSQLGANGAPPASATRGTTFTVDGVDLSDSGLGPFGSTTVSAGGSFRVADAKANVAIVDANYAKANKLAVGSTITIAHVPFTIIGIVAQPEGGGAANVYIPLGRAQALAATAQIASSVGKVDTIYVVADSAADIATVQKEIAKLVPGATVTTASSLASDVSGSLASASSLINDLGRWLSAAVLIAAFVVASLLSAAAVARRVPEIGTLKALGWRTRRIVGQIMGEFAVVGLLGAVVGIAVGFAGAAVVDALAPGLAATVSDNPGSAPAENVTFGSSGVHHFIAQGAQNTVPVHLTAPVTLDAVLLGVALALLGAIIAGSFGAWRAARLRPVQALARVT